MLCKQRVSGEHLAAAALPGCWQYGSADWRQALGPGALNWLRPASCMMSAEMLSSPACSFFACCCKSLSLQPSTVNSAAQRGECYQKL